MFLNDAIPEPRPIQPRRPDGPNDVPFVSRGPFLARIRNFAKVFYELDSSPDNGHSRRVPPGTPGSTARIRVHVRFDQLTNNLGDPLVLSKKYRASREKGAIFAKLMAALAGIRNDEVKTTNLDLEHFEGHRVSVTLEAHSSGQARIATIEALPVDASITLAAVEPTDERVAPPQNLPVPLALDRPLTNRPDAPWNANRTEHQANGGSERVPEWVVTDTAQNGNGKTADILGYSVAPEYARRNGRGNS